VRGPRTVTKAPRLASFDSIRTVVPQKIVKAEARVARELDPARFRNGKPRFRLGRRFHTEAIVFVSIQKVSAWRERFDVL